MKKRRIHAGRGKRRKPYNADDSTTVRRSPDRPRQNPDDFVITVIKAIVLQAFLCDYRADPDGVMVRELFRQLYESTDAEELLEKWERAVVHRRSEDLPRVDLARHGSEVAREICRQLSESKNPKQLLRKWARALVDGRLDDLPLVR